MTRQNNHYQEIVRNQWDQEGRKHMEIKCNKGQEINYFHAKKKN